MRLESFTTVAAARDAERFERIGGEHAHLGVGGGISRAHGVGVELHELPETPWPRLFVAVNVAGLIAPERFRQRVEAPCDISRQRRRQVVAQRNPLLVLVLKREHAFVRPVGVRKELSERIGVFECRRIERFEPVPLVNVSDGAQHMLERAYLLRFNVAHALGQARLHQCGLFLAGHTGKK